MKPHYDILIPDYYCCDMIFPNMPHMPMLGSELFLNQLSVVPGGGLNTVIALRRLGVNLGFVSELGNDFFSLFIRDRLRTEGVDLNLIDMHDQPFQRVTVALSFPHDRAFVTYYEAPKTDHLGLAWRALDQADFHHLHFNVLILDPEVLELLAECKRRGIFVSMECQHHELTLDTPIIRQVLSQVDLFMPNCHESELLTETHSPEEALEIFATFIAFTVIKCGKNGAIAARGGERYRSAALADVTPVDTTGAGDVFNAGFLAAHIRGLPIQTCLEWGNFCGGMSTQGIGGTTAAPTLAELEAWLISRQPA